MWEKFKESKFAKKCKELSRRGGVVAAVVCIALVLAVVLSVSIATNRAKKKYAGETDGTVNTPTEQTAEPAGNTGIIEGTVETPVHNNESEAPVVAEPEVFELTLPVNGVISKGHDATIQVWSETMEDYRVHLGVDIATEENAPVFAAADGVVSKIWDDALMGRCVAISHDGEVYTFYKNLDPVLSEGVLENAEIKCGQQLGRVGESAIAELADEPHLHIEMTVGGLAVDPTDYFSEEAKTTLSQNTGNESSTPSGAETEAANAEK